MSRADLIIYTDHLRLRMKLRKVPQELPKLIYLNAKERYWDIMTKHHIAVMICEVHGKQTEMAVSYDDQQKIVELITIHPVRTSQKLSRVKTGRWRKT